MPPPKPVLTSPVPWRRLDLARTEGAGRRRVGCSRAAGLGETSPSRSSHGKLACIQLCEECGNFSAHRTLTHRDHRAPIGALPGNISFTGFVCSYGWRHPGKPQGSRGALRCFVTVNQLQDTPACSNPAARCRSLGKLFRIH